MGARFEKISSYKDKEFALPIRKTKLSAGYDFAVVEDITIPSIYLQIFNMVSGKVKSPEFKERAGSLKAIKILTELGASNLSSLSEKARAEIGKVLLIQELPALIEFVDKEMTMDMDEIKDLTKSTKTKMTLVPTGVKVKLEDNQKLELMIRSSSPLNAYLMLANGVGLIDADYYDNKDNEGHIFFQVVNFSPFNIRIKKGDIIGQGVISTYDKTIDDISSDDRIGGFGSTPK